MQRSVTNFGSIPAKVLWHTVIVSCLTISPLYSFSQLTSSTHPNPAIDTIPNDQIKATVQ